MLVLCLGARRRRDVPPYRRTWPPDSIFGNFSGHADGDADVKKKDPFCATIARQHSDSNVLCLGGKIIG